MSRPSFEVADVIRIAGDSFRERYSASLTWPQQKVLDAIARLPHRCPRRSSRRLPKLRAPGHLV